MTEYRIRKASLADEAAVVALWATCDLTVSYNDPHADFRFALNKYGSDVLLALDVGEKIVGSVMVGHDGHRGWIYYVAAHPNKRNHAIGRTIVEAAENWLKERGVGKVQLMVRETNTAVQTFYERLGYEHTPRVVMAKWLKHSD
ncbi:MAG: GNAT family acetyltransferase [Sphingomonadales bacterium]|nr:GNAT family acetyltransferase [Sphingomonadales bacterium]